MHNTPDEIKRNIVTCMELNMEKFMPGATQKALGDALAIIQQLQDENAQQARCIENMTDKLNAMNDEVAKLQAERDSLVADVRMEGGLCSICMHADEMAHSESCKDCNALVETDHCNWEWRGVQKEDSDDGKE